MQCICLLSYVPGIACNAVPLECSCKGANNKCKSTTTQARGIECENCNGARAGDELRLKHTCAGADSRPWAGGGVVVRLCEASEEVGLELRGGGAPPVATTVGYTVEFVWKSATFDRMQRALKAFAVDEACVSGYLYHRCAALEPKQCLGNP